MLCISTLYSIQNIFILKIISLSTLVNMIPVCVHKKYHEKRERIKVKGEGEGEGEGELKRI